MSHESNSESDTGHEIAEETECAAIFQPVVNLKEVEQQKDSFIAVYKERAKLFRFDSAVKEWKERGQGDVKIGHLESDPQMAVEMRREKVLKLCANHRITEAMQLKPAMGNDKSWIWSVYADHSETPATSEIFAIRFSTVAQANEFKAAFEAAQETNKALAEAESACCCKDKSACCCKDQSACCCKDKSVCCCKDKSACCKPSKTNAECCESSSNYGCCKPVSQQSGGCCSENLKCCKPASMQQFGGGCCSEKSGCCKSSGESDCCNGASSCDEDAAGCCQSMPAASCCQKRNC